MGIFKSRDPTKIVYINDEKILYYERRYNDSRLTPEQHRYACDRVSELKDTKAKEKIKDAPLVYDYVLLKMRSRT